MSSTRYAKPGSPLKQNRYASSPEFGAGLLGNLVAKRCRVLESAEDRELIWALQYFSNREGGLAQVAAGLREQFAARIGTKKMREFGVKPEAIYKADQVRELRRDFTCSDESFLLRGEFDGAWSLTELLDNDDWHREAKDRLRAEAAKQPLTYPGVAFLNVCERAARNLADDLNAVCLDPAKSFDSVWYFHELRDCLREYQRTAFDKSGFAETTLSKSIWSEILDVSEMGGTVLLHNSSGNGKSFAAKAYCEAYPGRARYVLVPATNDATAFWRTLAGAVGSADGLSYKCDQLRDRAVQTLLSGDLVLVLDNCQWLFPVSDYRYALPNRINWMLELSERGVPVVMIGDTKLFDTLGFVEARTGWNRNKFVNQLSNVVELPAGLPVEEVRGVAAVLLPDGDRTAQRTLADCMIAAPGYLHSGIPAAQRARRFAAADHRVRVTQADMDAALETSMKPSFKALESGLKRADAAAGKSKTKVRNWRPDTEAQTAAKSGKRRNQIVTSSDMQRAGLPDSGADSSGQADDFRPSGNNRLGNTGSGQRQIAPDLVTA
jgi:hypothetical protein